MDETKILMPEKEVKIWSFGAPVTVGALKWRDGLLFVAKISQTMLQQAEFIAGVGRDGLAVLTIESITSVVAGSADLVEWLLTRTVSIRMNFMVAGQVNTLPVVDVLRLLDAALAVNLSEEVLGLGKSVGGRLAALMAPRPASAPSTPSSSATVTAAKN